MPKISKHSIKVFHKDIDKYFDVVVNYNQKLHFYITIPMEFTEALLTVAEKEMQELSIKKTYSKGYANKDYSFIITSESEENCLKQAKTCFKVLMDKTLVQRAVIVVLYYPNDIIGLADHRYTKGFEQIGIRFGLTYATETTSGDKKIYSTYEEHDMFGEKRIERKELNLWGKNSTTIIPDTPKNRQMLEKLYDNLMQLRNKLKEFTSSPETMLDFIDRGVKMLNS